MKDAKNEKEKSAVVSEHTVSNAPDKKTPAKSQANRDPRGLGYYAVDKTMDTLKGGLRHMEEEKPGTCRRMAGVAVTGIGLTTAGIGIALLVP